MTPEEKKLAELLEKLEILILEGTEPKYIIPTEKAISMLRNKINEQKG